MSAFEIELIEDACRYSDMAQDAERLERLRDLAEDDTAVARYEMDKLLPNVSQRHVIALLAAVDQLVVKAGWSHQSGAIGAREYIGDAIVSLKESLEE